MAKTLLVAAMSGGVDSSVAAALALEAGFAVRGVTLRMKDALTAGACGGDPAEEQRIVQIADGLGIEHEFLDATADFRRAVLEYSWCEYAAGRTPNPCAWCNRELKFGRLADYARACGAEGLITGHYARIERDEAGNPVVRKAADDAKNQVYFLSLLRREQLAFARMPLASWHKPEVRRKAAELGLACGSARESQDACFTFPGESFPASLGRYFGRETPPGDIVDETGRVLGRHRGLHHYTIGQRKGLEVAMGVPAYVLALDVARNQVVLTTDRTRMACRSIGVAAVNFLAEPLPDGAEIAVQFRYRQRPMAARVFRVGDSDARIELAEPASRPACGQVAAWYVGDRLMAGGIIESVEQ